MPQIKPANRASAVEKLHRAETAIRKAEEAIQSITAEDLEEIGFAGYDQAATAPRPNPRSARNMIYNVYAHAGTLRIVREHLRAEMGCD